MARAQPAMVRAAEPGEGARLDHRSAPTRRREASPSGLESTWGMVVAMGLLPGVLFLRSWMMAGRAGASNPPGTKGIVARR